LAEGFSRQSYKEKSQFYSISLGSITELQNQLIISRDLKYVSNDIFNSIIDQSIIVHKITNALIKSSKEKFS
jgi:four helix bundle protein